MPVVIDPIRGGRRREGVVRKHVWSRRRSPVGIDPVRGRRREAVVVWIEHRSWFRNAIRRKSE